MLHPVRTLLTALAALALAVVALTSPGAGAAQAATSSYLCHGYTACAAAGYSNAGYAQVNKNKFWLMTQGHNCTNYVAYRMVSGGMPNVRPWTGTGNAYNWGRANASLTDQLPAVGAVAWWKAGVKGAGSLGHVAYVEQIVSATELIVSEDNWGGNFDWRHIHKASGWPTGFIHFNATGAGSPVGHLDQASSPKSHRLSLKGWAYDPDKVSKFVYIRVYVGQPSTTRQRLDLGPAQLYRPDVAKAHHGTGSNHGFDQTVKVTSSGKQLINVYGLNKSKTPGHSTLLYRGYVTIKGS